MPNHIVNVIEFSSAEAAKKVVTEAKTSDREFDFNTLIPMPESLDIESGSRTDEALILYELYTERPLNLFERNRFFDMERLIADRLLEKIGVLTKEKILAWCKAQDFDYLARGEVVYSNYKKYGAKTWYDWCIENWGTKWNAYEVKFDGTCKLTFQTAWAMPEPILKALTAKYPDADFTWTWADEDTGSNCGVAIHTKGTCVIFTPENQSNIAYKLYIKCWGESQCLGKDEKGNYFHYDCDNCPHADNC